jgi:hypothetical protein
MSHLGKHVYNNSDMQRGSRGHTSNPSRGKISYMQQIQETNI